MAEMVELGRINTSGTRSEFPIRELYHVSEVLIPSLLGTVLELGASTSVPSLLASTLDPAPESILTTDYPDEQLIK
jgi:hypothetical protein